MMRLLCLDLEGVLLPEIWINLAEHTGVAELRLTTRDIKDYDELMTKRLAVLRQHGIRYADIQTVIASMSPLPGAGEFLDQARKQFQVVILSDTFYQFAMPLMAALGHPTLFCHNLKIDEQGFIASYHLRLTDGKQQAVLRFKQLNFQVIASGDSYNDVTMLQAADRGILFCPPDNVVQDFPHYPVARDYDQLLQALRQADRHLADS